MPKQKTKIGPEGRDDAENAKPNFELSKETFKKATRNAKKINTT